MDQNDTKHETLTVMFEQTPPENTFFTINSQKASEILGVNRTRLSQLTGQGIFPYERRKVNSRSRLFYRLNDLLNYQRKSSFGNLHVQDEKEEFKNPAVALLPPARSETEQAPLKLSSKTSPFFKNKKSTHTRILQKALDLKMKEEEQKNTKNMHAIVNDLTLKFNQLMNSITHLQNEFLKLSKRKLNRKKSVLQSPCTKRNFKLIKRRNFK